MGAQMLKCGRKNHFAKMCHTKPVCFMAYKQIKMTKYQLNVSNILGLPMSVKLNVIKRINTIQEQNTPDSSNTKFYKKFKDVFDGLGCICDVIYHINIDPSYQPIIHPPCFVPIKLRPKLQEKLTCMESLDVIEKVNIPASWVNCTMTIVKPNGTLRIYINLRDLNKAIRHEHYPT